MPEAPKFFTVANIEGIPELTLGTADFVTRPIIVMAKEEITEYVKTHQPKQLVINFRNVSHISSEFISSMIRVRELVKANDGELKFSHMNQTVQEPFRITKLIGPLFTVYETTPEAIDAFSKT